jgi:Zn-finger nucleic acid-binding protein
LGVLESLLSKNLIESESIKEAYKKRPIAPKEVNRSQKKCPKCKVSLEVFNYSYDSNVFLDRCPNCLGIWADKGELSALAKYIKGNPEVDKYAEVLAKEFPKTSKLYSKKGKVIAVIISLFYLIIAPLAGGLEFFLEMLAFLVIPLACIFFGEHLGSLTGVRFRVSFCRPVVTKPTPGFLVVFGGWLLLLSPLFLLIYFAIAGV